MKILPLTTPLDSGGQEINTLLILKNQNCFNINMFFLELVTAVMRWLYCGKRGLKFIVLFISISCRELDTRLQLKELLNRLKK